MTIRRNRPLVLIPIIWLLTIAASCPKPPAALTPEARVAWHNTRVIKALDLVRDTAIDAHRQGIMQEDETRKVVLWHQSAVRVIDASRMGWQAAVRTSLDELRDALSDEDRRKLSIYFTMIRSLIDEPQTTRNGYIIRERLGNLNGLYLYGTSSSDLGTLDSAYQGQELRGVIKLAPSGEVVR